MNWQQMEAEVDLRMEEIREANLRTRREVLRHSSEWKKSFTLARVKDTVVVGRPTTLYELAGQVQVHELFDPVLPIGEGKWFKCLFFDAHYAWVYTSKNGHSRYYSRPWDPRYREERTVSFDAIDFIQLAYGVKSTEALDILNRHLSQETLVKHWPYQGSSHYRKVLKDWNASPLAEHKLLGSLVDVFNQVVESGEMQLAKGKWLYEGVPLFFSSHRLMANRIGEDRSSFTRKINGLVALGMLCKVPLDAVPKSLVKRAMKEKEEKGYQFHQGFLCVPDFASAEPVVRERLALFTQHGLSLTNANRQMFVNLLSDSELDLIFPQVDTTRRFVSAEIQLQSLFVSLLADGPFTRDEFMTSAETVATPAEIKRVVREQWKRWLRETGARYRRPTKVEQEGYGLEGKQFVVFRTTEFGVEALRGYGSLLETHVDEVSDACSGGNRPPDRRRAS